MALVMMSLNSARAGTVTVLFQEVGSDVQTTISGSLGLSGVACGGFSMWRRRKRA